MFRFMMKLFDAIVFAISLLRTAERFIDSPDLHERLIALINAYLQRQERMVELKAIESALTERIDGLAVPDGTMS